MADTLLMLVHIDRRQLDDIGFGQFLAWTGQPKDASRSGPYVHDCDLGDWECKGIPSQPEGAGLWLFSWPWTEIVVEDGIKSVAYADTCTWSRPSMDDLVSLGVLPTTRAGAGEGA